MIGGGRSLRPPPAMDSLAQRGEAGVERRAGATMRRGVALEALGILRMAGALEGYAVVALRAEVGAIAFERSVPRQTGSSGSSRQSCGASKRSRPWLSSPAQRCSCASLSVVRESRRGRSHTPQPALAQIGPGPRRVSRAPGRPLRRCWRRRTRPCTQSIASPPASPPRLPAQASEVAPANHDREPTQFIHKDTRLVDFHKSAS